MNEKDFMKEYDTIFERTIIFSIISGSMGLVSLKNLFNEEKYNQRDIFEYGIHMVLDGKAPELISKVLTNIIDLETDKERKTLKTIQKDAVLSIQQGISPNDLMWIINSYVNIDLDKAVKKYAEINDFISNGILNKFNKYLEKSNETYNQISKEVSDEFSRIKNKSM
jgi:flagellar motor component MotA